MAKLAVKKGKIAPSSDVLPRYLQGAAFTPRNLRRVGGGSKGKGLGKKKKHRLPTPMGVEWANTKGEVLL